MKIGYNWIWATILPLFFLASSALQKKLPNVIIIITDDQGYGDLGITGNPHVKTPAIDKFAQESVRFNNFYVSPVCAPTRSSLMTGRYSLRTGIKDTYNGGAIMASSEVTIAEMLKQANYKTGIFGKWHLGDNYPSRPCDQGFDESLIHLGGGMGQVGDITTFFKKDKSYFDPVLWHNNKQEAYQGYCSDIFTDEALKFIEGNKKSPFFCYLAFNAPHTPLQVPEKYYQLYKDIDPASGFEKDGRPFKPMTDKDKENARKVYAMVSNIDDNLAKLFKKLDELDIDDNTLILFMTDNGPEQTRYVSGMRAGKGFTYQGGIRVPCFMKLPASFPKNKDIATLAAHIDILPTLAQICKVKTPNGNKIDGKSLLPLVMDQKVDWNDRPFFNYWSRAYPELYNNMTLIKGKYKLHGKADYNATIGDFELFNLEEDPYEQKNIVSGNENIAIDLKKDMDKMYNELVTSENLINPPRIVVGNKNENPVILNRNDAGGDRGVWAQEEIFGLWKVKIQQGNYNIRYKFINPVKANGKMYLQTNTLLRQKQNNEETDLIEMTNVYLPAMDCDLIPFYTIDSKKIMPFWVEIEKID